MPSLQDELKKLKGKAGRAARKAEPKSQIRECERCGQKDRFEGKVCRWCQEELEELDRP